MNYSLTTFDNDELWAIIHALTDALNSLNPQSDAYFLLYHARLVVYNNLEIRGEVPSSF